MPETTNPDLDRRKIRRFRRYLAEERLESDTYRYLARTRTGEEREVFLALTLAEERHEQYWLNLLGNYAVPAPRPRLRSRILNYFVRTFGHVFILAMMQRTEQRSDYDIDQDAPAEMAADEKIHSEVVRGLAAKQRARISGNFRAAVFGVNDGLVSTCALILGVVGTGTTKAAVVAAGLAGMLAGALSMGAGEYVSVHSQAELLQASDPDPDTDRALADLDIDENELALVFRARGESADEAERSADNLIKRIKEGEEGHLTHHRESHEEIGTGLRAGMSSFICFTLGAFVPLFPFLLPLAIKPAAITAIILVGLLLMSTGAIVGLLSGANPLPKALRQLAIGYGAASITFVIGLLLGA